ncbi:hypothetical protein H2203_008704 [Taxawa tesnikishii (nom. ined.)]|nr:hypothetical protein H2203_008704 [Dothideales sp. JES 119]
MPSFSSSEEWQRQSALLLQARPTTTRITTKYNIPNLSSPKYAKALANKKRKLDTPTEPDAPTAQTPRAYLTLKTYDPASGVVLKYKTDKAAEVGRLIGSLARLGRHMAALPEIKDDVPMPDAPAAEQGSGTGTPVPEAAAAAAAEPSKPQTGGGGGGGGGAKKKKKGKR